MPIVRMPSGRVKRLGKLEFGDALRFAVRSEVYAQQLAHSHTVDKQDRLFAESQAIGSRQERVLGRNFEFFGAGLEHHHAALTGIGNVGGAIASHGNVVAESNITGKNVATLGRTRFQVEGFYRGRIASAVVVMVGTYPESLEFFVGIYTVNGIQTIGAGLYPLRYRGCSVWNTAHVGLAQTAYDQGSILGRGDALGEEARTWESDLSHRLRRIRAHDGGNHKCQVHSTLLSELCHRYSIIYRK